MKFETNNWTEKIFAASYFYEAWSVLRHRESFKIDNFKKINELACPPNVSEYGMLSRFHSAIFITMMSTEKAGIARRYFSETRTGQVEA